MMRSSSAECLDRLLGERPNKFRHYSNTGLSPRVAAAFNATVPSHPAAQPRVSGLSSPCAPYARVHPQQSCYPAPISAHVGSPFALHLPCTQTTAIGGLNSPPAGMVPPVYSGSLQAEYSVSTRSIQDFVMEGFTGYDVDALDPSLTDLQLQGKFKCNALQKHEKCTVRCHLVGVWVCRFTFFQSPYHQWHPQLVRKLLRLSSSSKMAHPNATGGQGLRGGSRITVCSVVQGRSGGAMLKPYKTTSSRSLSVHTSTQTIRNKTP